MSARPDRLTRTRWLLWHIERYAMLAMLTVAATCTATSTALRFYKYWYNWQKTRHDWTLTIYSSCNEILFFVFVAALLAALVSPGIRRSWLIYAAMGTSLLGLLLYDHSATSRP